MAELKSESIVPSTYQIFPDKGEKNNELSMPSMETSENQLAGRKAFHHLLIDRPFSSIDKFKETTDYLMYCLRYRTHVSLKKNTKMKLLGRGRSAANKKDSTHVSLNDTLLSLLQEYDVAGRVEICRLLLERRSPVPLFLPNSEHHLSVLRLLNKNVDGKTNICLGEDVTLMRVAIISCRGKQRSQTSEILKHVFNIESFHREDYSNESLTTWETAAEIGIGSVWNQESNSDNETGSEENLNSGSRTIENFLVLNVIGDFEPLWQFIIEFSDYLIVEDSLVEKESFLQRQVVQKQNLTRKQLSEISIVICEPSTEQPSYEIIDTERFSYYSIQSAIDTKLYKILCEDLCDEKKKKNWTKSPRNQLYKMQLPGKRSIEYPATVLNEAMDLHNLRPNVFVLQNSFGLQAQLEKEKTQAHNNEKQLQETDIKIKNLIKKRLKDAPVVDRHKLVALMRDIFDQSDANVRVLEILQLEKVLEKRCDTLLSSLRKEIERLSAESTGNLQRKPNTSTTSKANKDLLAAKQKYNDSVVSTVHIWREMSHIYVANNSTKYPRLAAQHLIDGMSIELLDGDANMINIPWIEATLKEIEKKLLNKGQPSRIFVLSVMGLQSSGKSTLLNIMFGVQLKTSVGMCTRGINMQLIPVADRKEYDYILLLDTEGMRAPEYHGLDGSEKRDNQMATISILLADATVILIPDENDAAVKEILPIVLLAYQGSQLAEDKGGQMSSMLFFVYNRIDTQQKDKLSNILQILGATLKEAFTTVSTMAGAAPQSKESNVNPFNLFRKFKLDASNSKDSDVRILGNIKKSFTPPDDVPDPAYGEALAEFRQHIHNRVTSSDKWKGRTLYEFCNYLDLVWKCIMSADFTLNFKTVMERQAYDKMNAELKQCERQLSEEYSAQFKTIETDILKRKTDCNNEEFVQVEEFCQQLERSVQVKKNQLDQRVQDILSAKGREKWKLEFEVSWKRHTEEQKNYWRGLLDKFVNCQLNFDNIVEQYKIDMRREIRKLFEKKEALNMLTSEKNAKFTELYQKVLKDAQRKHPSVNVKDRVSQVYRYSAVIHSLPVNVLDHKEEQKIEPIINELGYGGRENPRPNEISVSKIDVFKEWFFSFFHKKEEQKRETTVPKELHDQIMGWLMDKKCFVDSIVEEVISITSSVTNKMQFNQNSELQFAHIFARVLVTKFMTNVHDKWERNNSVYAKLKQEASRKEMEAYFDQASQGVVDIKLFIVMLKANLEKVLPEAFEEEMTLLTIDKISSKDWLLDPKALLNYMDLELLKLIDNKQIQLVLDKIRKPKEFYDEVMRKLIERELPDDRREWGNFSQKIKRIIESAALTSSQVVPGRAKKFMEELHRQGFESGFRDNFLAKKFTNDSDGYDGCDNEESNEFLDQLVKQLKAAVDGIKDESDGSHRVANILDRLREKRTEEGVRPRCNEACPLCGSLCILPFGHKSAKKHNTFHQPRALSGGYWTETCDPRIAGSLVAHNCSTAENAQFWYNDKMNDYKDFGVVFPDWLQPTFMEHLPLREYILATYNQQIAKHYKKKPSVDIPPEYHHNLYNIRLQLKEKTNGGNKNP